MDDPCLVDLTTGEKKKLPLVDRLDGERLMNEEKEEEHAGDSTHNLFTVYIPLLLYTLTGNEPEILIS